MFYVLEGDLRWKLGDDVSTTPAGSFVFIPRGLAHCFQNVGEAPARMLIIFAPAGMERFSERVQAAELIAALCVGTPCVAPCAVAT